MKKSKNTLLIALGTFILVTAFTGCENSVSKSPVKVDSITANGAVKVYCDKGTNVEYLITSGFQGTSGLTLRVNADGTPKTCTSTSFDK